MNNYLNLKINSDFGYRISPIHGEEEFHTGCDYQPNNDTKTYSGISGIVLKCKYGQFGEGYYIQVYNNKYNLYCNHFHNKEILVKKFDKVKKNDVIANSGSTGNSTGIHIHLELFIPTFMIKNSFIKNLLKNIKYKIINNKIFLDPQTFFEFMENNNLEY